MDQSKGVEWPSRKTVLKTQNEAAAQASSLKRESQSEQRKRKLWMNTYVFGVKETKFNGSDVIIYAKTISYLDI